MQMMLKNKRHVSAAQGYFTLGMYAEAHDELEQIDPSQRDMPQVLAVRLELYQRTQRWELAQTIARQLMQDDPGSSQWPISLAYAVRRADCIEAAKSILLDAAVTHPDEPIIHYNLGCYECQLGNRSAAMDHLKRAFKLAPQCRAMALTDSDLELMRAELAEEDLADGDG